jgi:predicted helicase
MKRDLLPHQQEALVCIRDEFQIRNADRATVVMACGTGKTVLGAAVANQLAANWTVVFLPSIALVKQTLDCWRDQLPLGTNFLCVCSDQGVASAQDELEIDAEELACQVTTDADVIRRFLQSPATSGAVFCTYQSSQILADGIPPGFAFSLGVFDEAHRTATSEDSQFSVALKDANVPIEKRLFLTATPRRYRVREDGDPSPVYCMSDQQVYGRTVYRLSFDEAVRRGIICDYQVVVSVVTKDAVDTDFLRRGDVLLHSGGIAKASEIANLVALRKAVRDLGLTKAITYHSTVAGARRFTELAESLPAEPNIERDVQALHVNGQLAMKARIALLDEFGSAEHAMLSNARCLTEGVDIPAVNMVAFMSPKSSSIDIIQACGRAMRKAPGKERGYIFLPVLVDVTNGQSVAEAINASRLDMLWDVLEAMCEQDDQFKASLQRMRWGCGSESTSEEIERRVTLLGPSDLLGHIKRSVTTLAVSRLTATWDEYFGALLKYRGAHGDCNVPTDFRAGKLDLWHWVKQQRRDYRDGRLLPERVALLNEIDFSWGGRLKQRWNIYLEMLARFKQDHGHCDVPRGVDNQFFYWTRNTRHNMRRVDSSGRRSISWRRSAFVGSLVNETLNDELGRS